MIRRLWKRLTIRRRAQRLGEKIQSGYHTFLNPGYTPSLCPNWEVRKWNNQARTLVRLKHIICGYKPFDTHIGWLDDVYVATSALQIYGNLSKDVNYAVFGQLGTLVLGQHGKKEKPRPIIEFLIA